MIYPEKDVHVDANDTVTFTCVVHGSPLPHFTWSKNGINLHNDSQMTMREKQLTLRGISFTESVLEICGTKEEDSGMYSCTATNGYRIDSFKFNVSVVPRGKYLSD